MKVCEIRGEEIFTGDGDNSCEECDLEEKTLDEMARKRNATDSCMRDCGLTKVVGCLGGVYCE